MRELIIDIWLDDEPEKRQHMKPKGFVHFAPEEIEDLKDRLRSGMVDQLSLDHDLGVCGPCQIRAAVAKTDCGAACEHVGTGMDLLNWMKATNIWSLQKPVVHSMNIVAAQRMREFIEDHFPFSIENCEH